MQFMFNESGTASGGSPEYSEPVPMNGATAMQILGVFSGRDKATSWTIVLQGAMELSYWTDIVAWGSLGGSSRCLANRTGIGFGWVRIKLIQTGVGPATRAIYGEVSHE